MLAAAEDASLAGLEASDDGPVVALGAASGSSTPAVRWLDCPPDGGDPAAARVIAPAGEGLWRTAPWPAADALFDLEPPRGERAIVTGVEEGARAAVAERADARGVAVDLVERLDAGRLAEASCVVFADAPGAALPARAFAVLAARRLLIVPRLERTFGLEDGLDHAQFADDDDAVTLVEAYRQAADVFALMTEWGRIKADAQRASVVYGRLADDLRLHGRG